MDKNKIEGSSLNKQEEILSFLKSDLPEIFSEGKIDCKKLKQTLGEEVDDSNERYGLSWAGKNNCFKVIQEQTTATLKPAKDESFDFDQTQNLFIEGDNLEVLKVLQRSYYGKIKMIYIDPPYNTGNDFIYNDKFQENRDEYLESIGEKDDIGNTLRVDGLSRNAKDSGHYHSNWLNMMYPRLFLARNLLKQDGVIFVSIDDNEVKNLRTIMDEIFGEENFVAQLVWQKGAGTQNDNKYIAITHEYILCYTKNLENSFFYNLLPSQDMLKGYVLDDEYITTRGKFRLRNLNDFSIGDRPGLHYDITCPDGTILNGREHRWRCDKNRFDWRTENNRIVFFEPENGEKEWRVMYKQYINEKKEEIIKDEYGNLLSYGRIPTSLLVNIASTGDGKKELKKLFNNEMPFSYPKPTDLIRHLISIASKNSDLIADFFAGSGTTAHAVMEQNAKDKGDRKWICVQLPELCDEGSEAYKAGYKNIAEIGKERIRRAGDKIGKENKSNIDLGFKSLKLDKSNFKIWQGKFENSESLLGNMADFVDNIKSGSKEENILFELILKSGLDLNISIEEKKFADDKYYLLDGGKLIVYLGKKITEEMAEEIQKSKPEKFICLDGCFQNNDQLKTNISLQMEQEKIDFKVI